MKTQITLHEFAKLELERLGYPEPSFIRHNVLQLIDVFNDLNHSKLSAPVVIRLFSKLARFEKVE